MVRPAGCVQNGRDLQEQMDVVMQPLCFVCITSSNWLRRPFIFSSLCGQIISKITCNVLSWVF